MDEFGEHREETDGRAGRCYRAEAASSLCRGRWAEVMVKDGTMLFRGRVLDVSVGGCYIETEAKLKLAPGTPVEMVFRLNDDVFRCDAMSRMVRTRGAGFLFANQDAKMRRELERLIQELDRDN